MTTQTEATTPLTQADDAMPPQPMVEKDEEEVDANGKEGDEKLPEVIEANVDADVEGEPCAANGVNGVNGVKRKIFVGGLSRVSTDDTLRKHFEKFGDVLDATIMKNKFGGGHRGFGFVSFVDEEAVRSVLAKAHVIDGKSIECQLASGSTTLAPAKEKRSPYDAVLKGTKLFVGGLAPLTTQEQFQAYFAKYGGIRRAIILRHGFGFITFETSEAVQIVLSDGDHVLNGREIDCKVAKDNSQQPVQRRSRDEEFERNERVNGRRKSKKLFVGGMASRTTQEDVETYFRQFGKLVRAIILKHAQSGAPKGYGFVSFETFEAVEKVLANAEHVIAGKEVDVSVAHDNTDDGDRRRGYPDEENAIDDYLSRHPANGNGTASERDMLTVETRTSPLRAATTPALTRSLSASKSFGGNGKHRNGGRGGGGRGGMGKEFRVKMKMAPRLRRAYTDGTHNPREMPGARRRYDLMDGAHFHGHRMGPHGEFAIGHGHHGPPNWDAGDRLDPAEGGGPRRAYRDVNGYPLNNVNVMGSPMVHPGYLAQQQRTHAMNHAQFAHAQSGYPHHSYPPTMAHADSLAHHPLGTTHGHNPMQAHHLNGHHTHPTYLHHPGHPLHGHPHPLNHGPLSHHNHMHNHMHGHNSHMHGHHHRHNHVPTNHPSQDPNAHMNVHMHLNAQGQPPLQQPQYPPHGAHHIHPQAHPQPHPQGQAPHPQGPHPQGPHPQGHPQGANPGNQGQPGSPQADGNASPIWSGGGISNLGGGMGYGWGKPNQDASIWSDTAMYTGEEHLPQGQGQEGPGQGQRQGQGHSQAPSSPVEEGVPIQPAGGYAPSAAPTVTAGLQAVTSGIDGLALRTK